MNWPRNLLLNYTNNMQVTNRGFLTMFDDVSGFGAWHRRWVVLEGNTLAFWKYPENEKVMGKLPQKSLDNDSSSLLRPYWPN